jgi:hypothetical protein
VASAARTAGSATRDGVEFEAFIVPGGGSTRLVIAPDAPG